MTDNLSKLLDQLKKDGIIFDTELLDGLKKLASKFDNVELHRPADLLGRLFYTYSNTLSNLQRKPTLQEMLDFIELQSVSALARCKLEFLSNENAKLKAVIEPIVSKGENIETLASDLHQVFDCLHTEAHRQLALVGVWINKVEALKL